MLRESRTWPLVRSLEYCACTLGRSNHERLFLRRRHWAGWQRRRRFETIHINEPLRDGWVHKAEIQFRPVLKTECLECSVGDRSIHYLEFPIGNPFPHLDSSATQEFRNSSHEHPSFLLHTPAAVASSIPGSATVPCLRQGRPVEAAELREETIAAFDRYIGASERRIQSELHNGPFLFVDELGEKRRAEGYAQLREGQVLVKQMNTKEEGHPIEVPHGLIHDWIGVVFIPKVALAQTLAVVEDYDNHQKIYGPEVRHSRLLQHNGDNFKVFLQLYKKCLVTVVIDADFDIHYERFGTNRAVSRSYSTRLVEVEGVGRADQHELPVDDAHGYIWRLYSYWRFEEKDGGVCVQLESIGLSRTVPAIIGWLLNPLLSSIPRGILSSLLRATRATVTNLSTKASSPGKGELCSPGSRRPYTCSRREASQFWKFPGILKTSARHRTSCTRWTTGTSTAWG
jgi:hypothetical protein